MYIDYILLDITLIILYLLCFIKLKRNGMSFSPLFAFVIGIIYFVLVPLTMLTFNNGYTLNSLSGATGYWMSVNLNEINYLYPYLIIWGSLFLTGILIILIPLNKKKAISGLVVSNSRLKVIIFLIIFSIVFNLFIWSINIFQLGGISNYFSLHWYTRNQILYTNFGRFAVLFNKLFQANSTMFTGLSVAFSLLMCTENVLKTFKLKFLIVIILTMHLLIILFTGNRIYFALYLILVIFGMLSYGYKKQLISITFSLPILIFIFSAWSYTRSSLNNFNNAFSNYLQSLHEMNNSVVSMLFDVTEGSNVILLFHIINDYGRKFNFLDGSTYYRVFTSFLPDSSSISSFTVLSGNNYMPGTNVSLNSTIIGELYANFGILTLVLLPLIAIVFIFISKLIEFSNPIISFPFCVIVCWYVRSVFSDNFIIMLLVCVLIVIALTFYKLLAKQTAITNY